MHLFKIFAGNSLNLAAAFMLSAGLGVPAQAHVLLETPQATQGSFYKAVFRVPHGCHGLATTSIKVDIPDGIAGAKPMPKPGWNLSTTKGSSATQKDRVTSITWSGGSLPDDEYDEFVLVAHITDTLAPGFTVYFPVVQNCGDEANEWTDVPQPDQIAGELQKPAPGLRIIAATTPAPAKIVTAGFLQIATPWLRATPGGAKVAGGYLSITNKGSEPDRLVSAAIPVAVRGEIHEMSMDNGTMRMRELAGGLEIKAGETVELKPGGFHIMFQDLTEPLKQGDTVEGTLTFAKAGKVPVTFKVGGLADTAPPASEPAHMHMH
jgi:copper(I)-binding protein